MILGLDISDHAIAAAIVNDDATVVAHDRRGTATVADAADVARLFERHALSRVAAAARNPADVAIADLVSAAAGAVQIVDAPSVVATGAAVALAVVRGGQRDSDRGSVAAEQWVGAARAAMHPR